MSVLTGCVYQIRKSRSYIVISCKCADVAGHRGLSIVFVAFFFCFVHDNPNNGLLVEISQVIPVIYDSKVF